MKKKEWAGLFAIIFLWIFPGHQIYADSSNGLYFNGGQSVYVPYDGDELDGMSTITIEAWIKSTGNTADHQRIVSNWQPDAFQLFIAGDGVPAGSVAGAAAFQIGGENGNYWFSAGDVIRGDNTWHHLAGVYNGTEMILFVDGKEVGRKAVSLGNVRNIATNQMGIGSYNKADTGSFFTGNIKDVRIWNTARTATQIQSNLNTVFSSATSNLIGYWKLDSFTNETVNDFSSNANPGIGINFAAISPRLRIPESTPTSLTLQWNSYTNATQYELRRNGTLVYQGTGTDFTDSGLLPGVSYTYTLKVTGSTGSSNTSTLTTTTGPETYLTFNGLNRQVAVTDQSPFHFGTSYSFSAGMWIKTNISQPNYTSLLTKGTLVDPWKGFSLFFYENKLAAELRDDTTSVGVSEGLVGTTVLNDNIWHYVSIVANRATNNVSLYVDGQLEKTITNTNVSVDISNTATLYIGKGRTYSLYYNGKMSGVNMWNFAKTNTDIQHDMAKQWTGDEAGLLAYWKMDGIFSGKIYDSSPNGFHGQANGFNDKSQEVIIGINKGTLTITPPLVTTAFGNISLDNTIRTLYANLGTFETIDASGKGSGWHLTVSASRFKIVNGNGYMLPAGSLVLKAPIKTTVIGGSTSVYPSILYGSPYVIDDGNTYTLVSANPNEGIGRYQHQFPLNTLALTLNPGTAKTDLAAYPSSPTLYESKLTWTMVSGP